jgi:hypothetical protein
MTFLCFSHIFEFFLFVPHMDYKKLHSLHVIELFVPQVSQPSGFLSGVGLYKPLKLSYIGLKYFKTKSSDFSLCEHLL